MDYPYQQGLPANHIWMSRLSGPVFGRKTEGLAIDFRNERRNYVLGRTVAVTAEGPSVAVMGQGYVGLPLAQAIGAAGIKVRGFEVSEARVDALNSGVSHVDDLSDGQLGLMLERGYRATTDPAMLRSANVILICVPTPLDDSGGPDLAAVKAACRTISENSTPGVIVILESTTYPGTTENVVLPILAGGGKVHGRDFFLAFSPERVDPGSEEYGIRNTPKLVGGLDSAATKRAVDFYQQFVEVVVPLSGAKEAETAKLLENTYRHVNIALVNEMARFCHDLGINIWEVIRGAATKPFGFQAFTPGPGVGGHCIPIDPNYLGHHVKKTLGYQFRFVELAQEINNGMPHYVVSRIADLLNDEGKPLNGAKILLLGVTYKADIADQRESPATAIAQALRRSKALVSFHDPFVEEWELPGGAVARVEDLRAALQQADVAVILQNHKEYDCDEIAESATVLFDTRRDASGRSGVHSL